MLYQFYVEIVKRGYPEVVEERMGPMSLSKTEKVQRGINININHSDYFTRITEEGIAV